MDPDTHSLMPFEEQVIDDCTDYDWLNDFPYWEEALALSDFQFDVFLSSRNLHLYFFTKRKHREFFLVKRAIAARLPKELHM
jgi:hypothetical protein